MSASNSSFHIPLGRQGRIVIPAQARARLGLREGEQLRVVVDEDGLHITSSREAMRRARAMVANHVEPGTYTVDDFIAERRAAAAEGE